ncbi:MAG TPA: hypothetical protein VJO52_15435 [Gemmatimonadaceae bacterium]|nr:hypothetical protein [Gemmatimonadaceae bacterium]
MPFPARAVGLLALPALAVSLVAAPARAQDTTKAVNVGQQAPDFTAPGATRFGVLKDPIKLSGLRGQTVVLAFFFKARTKG